MYDPESFVGAPIALQLSGYLYDEEELLVAVKTILDEVLQCDSYNWRQQNNLVWKFVSELEHFACLTVASICIDISNLDNIQKRSGGATICSQGTDTPDSNVERKPHFCLCISTIASVRLAHACLASNWVSMGQLQLKKFNKCVEICNLGSI